MDVREVDRRVAARERRPEPGEARLWAQMKGSSLCCDFTCACGSTAHLDGATFLYYLTCPDCGASYNVTGSIELVRLTEEEEAVLRAYAGERPVFVVAEDSWDGIPVYKEQTRGTLGELAEEAETIRARRAAAEGER